MNRREMVSKFIHSRRSLMPDGGYIMPVDETAEGGCGVIGMASNVQVAAKHMLEALTQMRNRGNGKGGGIAAVGLVPEEFGVTQEILENDYLLSIAYLDATVREDLEKSYIDSIFLIDHVVAQDQIAEFSSLEGLDVRPPEVVHYFVRIKPEIVSAFIEDNGMKDVPSRRIEDEIVFQNTYRLNTTYYMSTGEKQAFVLSHGKNMLVLKMVGFGDDVIRYYQLENIHAHVWIGHHRYPTKGRVWHPGGAHPFIGMNEALVHNGDFANHASISEYLSQRNIYPLFLTDTEVAVQVFDLLHRIYDYPLEYAIEAMAPTTERDFNQLPEEKQTLYRPLQVSHMHCSPDGPWFFLIAQSDTHAVSGPEYRLTGITDTSMLRPQVFAWQEQTLETGEKVAIGLAASEKQGIDAAMLSLSETDDRFWPRADRYWNARGGSHTDGGAFIFEVQDSNDRMPTIRLYDKFGKPVPVPNSNSPYSESHWEEESSQNMLDLPADEMFAWYLEEVISWTYADLRFFLMEVVGRAGKQYRWGEVIALLTLMLNRRYSTGILRRSSVLVQIDNALDAVFEQLSMGVSQDHIGISQGKDHPVTTGENQVAVVDARGYQPEGESSVSRELHRLYEHGFRKFIVTNARGHRFIGAGFGPETGGVRIDVYGSSGDYLGSGLDGLEIHVHNNGQDQLAQIMKAGKLVVHGDVGQTFMYGAKGGEAYILGSAAGRPLINAVGKPRVVINGTCLDYLAESFMAGDPLNGGGFVILNGIQFDHENQIVELETPYPGGNLFSLASGGAIYVRDPHGLVTEDQLNGGEFAPFISEDWTLIQPYLEENERLFEIPVDRLLTVDGILKSPEQVYRKIQPVAVRALQAEESWVIKSH